MRLRIAILAAILGLSPSIGRAQDSPDDAREARANERFLSVLEKSPRRGTALDRVYGYHVERGSLDAFLKTYQAKVAADPKDGQSWLLIGLVEAQRGRDAAAVEAFGKAEAARPDDPMPPYYLGQALVLVGQPDAAAEGFERALTRRPSRADLLEIYQALGRVHQRAHRNDKALAVWDRLEKAFPDDPRVQEQIAHALADEGQDAPALKRFEALAKGSKDRFRQVQFAIEAAELKVKLGKPADALADFEGLLGKLDPESWLYREVRRKVEDVFLRTDDLAGLARYYEAWVKKVPDDVEAMARLGRTLANQGRAPEARVWFDRAVKLAPSRRELRLALIEQLNQERKFAEAAGQYEALAKADPNNPDVVRDWGRTLLRDASRPEAERRKAAAGVWRRLAPDDTKDPVAVAQAADLFRQASMTDEAIALYKKAIALAPDASQYREYLGEYYHALKRPDDAFAAWRSTAEGPRRNARTLGRLGEVLAGFGYRKEAVEPLTEACKLEPDDFDLRIRLADLDLAMEKPAEALAELDRAAKVAPAEEQAEAVLDRQIKAYQATGALGARIKALQDDLAKAPTAPGWTRLARFLEADGKPPEAARAIGEATVIDPKSVAAWTATARLRESAGDLIGSAEAFRTLTALDRRNRTEYLTGIAKLESRLGRRGPALEAGRELLAAAPGNPDNHQFFAELCFGLGENDEGLDALRRSARANPSDPKATLVLAENLARQFRAEEAIELYWRAFARTLDIDGKLSIVSRMADQYLQRNQLDRLIGRLERELREPGQQRELSLCLAQAHAASGDFATARIELERLLATNARDSHLLVQLSGLAEQEGDISGAAKYARQAMDISPTAEGTIRLAQLYVRAGEIGEAETVWSKMAGEGQDSARVLGAIDQLLGQGKNEAVLAITERLLLKRPGDWEALYREGVALENLARPADAGRRFRAILDLKADDDDLSQQARARRRNNSAATAPAASQGTSTRVATAPLFPMQGRIGAVYQVRAATRLDIERASATTLGGAWSPADFGQARMAALGWLYARAIKEEKPESVLGPAREAKDKPQADPRSRRDWYYLQLIRSEGPATFEAARDYARSSPGDLAAEFAYLAALPARAVERATRVASANVAVDKTPPLAGDDLDRMLACFRDFRKRKPDYPPVYLLTGVTAELKRAKRGDEPDRFYREIVDGAVDIPGLDAAIAQAGERGDVDALFALREKHDRLQAGKPAGPPVSINSGINAAYCQAMNKRSEAKAPGDVARLLDNYLAATRTPDAVARRAKARNAAATATATRNYVYIYVGKTQKAVTLDFPTPNAYFDSTAIQVLRNAYELYKRDDLASDFTAHVKAQAARLPEGERAYGLLASASVAWWDDAKDDALRDLALAVEAVPGDVDLRIGLAELRSKRGEQAEALELVDAYEPPDQKGMQRREILALRLAVLAGDVERARKAAERLFGLRLDADTQVQLAAQMNQLGQHDLAEAVLGRARRRAGGNMASLVSLMLQYQKQGKTDTAFQVANQILRSSSGRASAGGPQTVATVNDETARREAIQVLARSGKLAELIARSEAQLKAAPGSTSALQSLSEYYTAAGDKEKSRATLARLSELRPDDARLRIQVATQLVQAGDAAGAIPNFVAAIKKEPALYVNRYWEIQQAFQQAGKLADLGKLFEELDLKSFANNPYAIQQVISSLMQDEKTRDLGMKLFRKAWKDMPDGRANMLSNMDEEAIWQLPEVFDNARDAVIPQVGKASIRPWESVDQIYSYMGNGKVTGVLSRLIETATRQNKLDALAREVEAGVRRFPEWSGGRALRAVILVRQGKADEAKAELTALIEADKEIPTAARMIIGQELDGIKALDEVALRLYEGAVGDDELTQLDYQFGPANRLVTLYHQAGKDEKARDLVLKYSRRPSNQNYGNNPGYAEYQKIQAWIAYGQQMMTLGYPADAVRFFDEILADTDAIVAAKAWGGGDNYSEQARTGLDQALNGLSPKNLEQTLRALVPPRPGKDGPYPPVDLGLIVHPKDLEKASPTSLFGEAIRNAARGKHAGLLAEVKAGLAARAEADPRDLNTAIASGLVAAAEGDSQAIDRASARLAELAESAPLDALPAGLKPNARQRAEAARQVGLWLVGREALKHDPSRKAGEALEARALEASRRLADGRWTLAMLREAGQAAFDRGDRAAAEAYWRQMLRQVLAPPSAPRPKKVQEKPAPAPKVTAGPGLAAGLLAVVQVPPPPPSPVVVTVRAGASPTVATLERFEQAAQIALLASDHGMHELSAEAIREALGGGPPVVPIAIGTSNGRVLRSGGGETVDPSARQVEERLHGLDASWTRNRMPPALAYEAIAATVLPAGRPDEVFLFPRPLSFGIITPRSVGAILARRAVEAGRVAELRGRAEARKARSMAAVPAEVLDAQLALAERDDPAAARILRALADRLKTDTLQVTAELACHAALPALDLPAAGPVALGLVEKASRSLGTSGNPEPQGMLMLAVARRKFRAGRPDDARATLNEYLEKMQANGLRYGGDYSLYFRKQQLATVAAEFAQAGQIADTWDFIGRYADAPSSKDYGIDPELGGTIARAAALVLDRPPAERFNVLRAWSMPTADRKSIRLLASAAPEDLAIPARFGAIPGASLHGLASTPDLLIDAARSVGKLDALLAEVEGAAAAKVENAEPLLGLVRIASGRDAEVAPTLASRTEAIALANAAPPEPSAGRRRVSQRRSFDWPDFLIARAALASARLAPAAEASLRAQVDRATASGDNDFLGLARLRRALALHLASRAGTLAEPAGDDPGLAHWRPSRDRGTTPALWVESGGIVSHVAGPGSDSVVMDIPLAGTFEVNADVFLGPQAEGHLGFGGLIFATDSNASVQSVGGGSRKAASYRFSRPSSWNRITIRSSPDRLRVLLNGHLYHEEADPSATSPWLAFHAGAGRQTAFRDVTISGSPEIPREVRMVQADRLEGWITSFYYETRPPRLGLGDRVPDPYNGGMTTTLEVGDLDKYDWHAKEGVIVGRKSEATLASSVVPSRIAYHRPIGEGESVAYEFFHEPGAVMTHPTLDRLAFVIEPGGVKLHWMTDATENDWTGLAADNALEAPDCRRGPDRPPLKPGEWNAATLRIEAGKALLDLNGVRIFEYPLEPANARVFGFYHDKGKTEAKLRAVVLRGPWPEKLPGDLLGREVADPALADRRARSAMVLDRFALLASDEVLAAGRRLDGAKRYDYLIEHVLPSPDHAGFRLRGAFAPDGSGTIEAPALDLIASAKAQGRLPELLARVDAAEAPDGPRQRDRLAFRAAVLAGLGRGDEAGKALGELGPLIAAMADDEPEWARWPALLAASATFDSSPSEAPAMALLDTMDLRWRSKHQVAWGTIVRAIRTRGKIPARAGADPEGQGFRPVTHGDAASHGQGLPSPIWTFADGAWAHNPGHRRDYLFLASPIVGNFEVESELTSFDYRETQLSYGDLAVGIRHDKKSLQLRHYSKAESSLPIDPPLAEIKPWYAFKLAVKDGALTASVDGRAIHGTQLPAEPDPWLAIATSAELDGGARNIKITGNPVIPDVLNLSNRPTLAGWVDDYYPDANLLWRKTGDEIVGRRLRDPGSAPDPGEAMAGTPPRPVGLAGSKMESLLRYARPVLEDGEITYEFHHDPGKAAVHPALGRLAFLIEPDGVRLHRLTDAQYERTGLAPDNAAVEPDHRRGPASPPLRAGDWNRLKLAVAGETLTITLNDVLIYERPIEGREFGLFYFADESEARARNVTYRGHWPKSLPANLYPGR